MFDYIPPSAADLQRLKDGLGYTGNQMAELAALAGNSQWRKYTGGAAPRSMSPHMLFFMAARLTLPPDDLHRVAAKMQEIGAQLDAEALAGVS